MLKTRVIHPNTSKEDLCETYSTSGRNLIKDETGEEFGSVVTDEIEGYDESGKPYSRYHYKEVGGDEADESDLIAALEELGVTDDEA